MCDVPACLGRRDRHQLAAVPSKPAPCVCAGSLAQRTGCPAVPRGQVPHHQCMVVTRVVGYLSEKTRTGAPLLGYRHEWVSGYGNWFSNSRLQMHQRVEVALILSFRSKNHISKFFLTTKHIRTYQLFHDHLDELQLRYLYNDHIIYSDKSWNQDSVLLYLDIYFSDSYGYDSTRGLEIYQWLPSYS